MGFILDDVEPGSVAAFLGFQSGGWVETVNEGDVVSLAEAITRLDGARQVEELAGPGPGTWRVWPSALAEPCLPGAEWPARKLLVPRYFAVRTGSGVWPGISGPGQLFDRLGFANDSFIQRVNGTPVDGPDAYIAALLKAIDGAEVSFEVSRRRKTFGHVHQQVWDGDLNASVPGRWSAGRLHLTLRSPEPRTRPR